MALDRRTATPADAALLAELRLRQLTDEGDDPGELRALRGPILDYFEEMLAAGRLTQWLVFDGERPVATAGLGIDRRPPSPNHPRGVVGFVQNVYTDRDYRGRGLASELVRLACELARERGCAAVQLNASADGKPVYQKLGFREHPPHLNLWL